MEGRGLWDTTRRRLTLDGRASGSYTSPDEMRKLESELKTSQKFVSVDQRMLNTDFMLQTGLVWC